jgi:hypothetical protein
MNVGQEQQHARQFLAARNNTELGGLLDRVGGVAAGVGEPDDLGFRGLRLQRKEEKSDVFRGCLTPPTTLPPLARTTDVVSRSSAAPKA